MLCSRQVAVLGLRNFSSLRPRYKGKIPNGSLFAPLQSGGKVMFPHRLDDESDYRRFLREELPLEVIDEVPQECQTAESVVELMNYNIPLFPPSWTYTPELIYITVTPKDKQTPEGYRMARILRACFDVRYTGFTILDDIMDKSDKRQGKPAWKNVAPNGMSGALCGGMLLNQMPYYLLKKYFQGLPLYRRMVDAMIHADFQGMIGCMMDVYGQGGSEGKTLDPAISISTYKLGTIISMQAILGMHYVGIDDLALEKKVMTFQTIVGELFQSWDDFCDYYCTPVETGKPSLDFVNGSTTWTSGAALSMFTDEQKRIFQENYGSLDPNKHEIVKKLYDDIDLTSAYIKYAKKRAHHCYDLIKGMNHPGMQEALTSQLEWLVGDLYLEK